MKTPYFVEPESEGCRRCGTGKTWNVIGPDDVALARTFGDKDEAYHQAAILNEAYQAGYHQGVFKEHAASSLDADVRQLGAEIVKGSGAGIRAIFEAREAQLAQGYDAAHDDALEENGLLVRAACWLISELGLSFVGAPMWAHTFATNHKADSHRMLAAAGALIAAEIDRLKRAETREAEIDREVDRHVAALDADEAEAATEAAEAADEVIL